MSLRSPLVFVFFFILGSASWILVNAIFLQLPLFITKLPEFYKLSYYLALSVQCGNVLVIIYMVIGYLRHRKESSVKGRFKEYVAIPLVVASACVVGILLAFIWNLTYNGYSISLWILTGCAGAVGALSNLTFWSYAATFKPFCMIGLSTGMGFSSVLPAILAAIQQPGTLDRFSCFVYFLLIALWVLFSLISFFILQYAPWIKSYRREIDMLLEIPLSDLSDQERKSMSKGGASSTLFFSYLFILFVISCCNFFLPAVLSYFTLEDDPRILTWILIVGMIGQPIGRCIHLVLQRWSPHKSIPWILFLIQLILFSFYFILGKPLHIFPWLLIALHFVFSFLFGFSCTLFFQRLSLVAESMARAQHFCRWLGCVEQLGACISSILACFIGKYILFA
jgi:hypothetical protein